MKRKRGRESERVLEELERFYARDCVMDRARTSDYRFLNFKETRASEYRVMEGGEVLERSSLASSCLSGRGDIYCRSC